MTGTARYLFAIASGPIERERFDRVRGHGGAPVELVTHHGLTAVVCDVPLEEFDEQPLRLNLENLEWVERVARTHDDVVRTTAENATTAPMRLVIICHDDDSVRKRIDEWNDQLRQALSRVNGRSEWSVKAYAKVADASVESAPTGESGVAYLQRKRAAVDARRMTERRMVELADEIHGAFSAQSVASRMLNAQDPKLTGRGEPMLLNAAYLVDDAEIESFARTGRAVRAQHADADLIIQGPWPPYSFAVIE